MNTTTTARNTNAKKGNRKEKRPFVGDGSGDDGTAGAKSSKRQRAPISSSRKKLPAATAGIAIPGMRNDDGNDVKEGENDDLVRKRGRKKGEKKKKVKGKTKVKKVKGKAKACFFVDSDFDIDDDDEDEAKAVAVVVQCKEEVVPSSRRLRGGRSNDLQSTKTPTLV